MSTKLNVIEFDEINEQGFEKTSKRTKNAMKRGGKKEELRNKRKESAKRKGRM